jgi:beta-lactamase superfamily II metal-dependent hydrolase
LVREVFVGKKRGKRASFWGTVAVLSLGLLAARCDALFLSPPSNPSGLLEIHHINVGQGDATLVIGPNRTTLLIDAGKPGRGTDTVVPYLQSLGISPDHELDYMVASHRDSDHLGGLDEVIHAGYTVRKKIWDNGSSKSDTRQINDFLAAAKTTLAGDVSTPSLGETLDLGGGATATVVAIGGDVSETGTTITSGDAEEAENDKSIALLIQYRQFDYITAGDLGGGETDADRACTGRGTKQEDIESILAESLMPGGGAALLTRNGVEVLHVNHHGSESSTNANYRNLLTPAVAIISVGSDQGASFDHPRKDVVEKVLLAEGACITAEKAFVLQTGEEAAPIGTNTSTAGYVVGNIIIRTSGVGTYEIKGTGNATPDERERAGVESFRSFPLDP